MQDAIVGEGTTDVEVLFPEQAPIQIKSKLLAFNGGVSGGKTTLFIHAYLSSPIAAAIVTTVKVTKIHNGRYGLKSVAAIPKIAGGRGSVTNFNLTIGKQEGLPDRQMPGRPPRRPGRGGIRRRHQGERRCDASLHSEGLDPGSA